MVVLGAASVASFSPSRRVAVAGRRGDERDAERAGEADDADGERDRYDGGGRPRIVEQKLGLDAEGQRVGEVDIHAGLQPCALHAVTPIARARAYTSNAAATRPTVIVIVLPCVRDGDDAAVAQEGELVAEADLGDADVVEPGGLAVRVEERAEGGDDGVVAGGVGAKLRDGLGDEHVEPVDGLGRVVGRIVVGLAKDERGGERRGGAKDG